MKDEERVDVEMVDEQRNDGVPSRRRSGSMSRTSHPADDSAPPPQDPVDAVMLDSQTSIPSHHPLEEQPSKAATFRPSMSRTPISTATNQSMQLAAETSMVPTHPTTTQPRMSMANLQSPDTRPQPASWSGKAARLDTGTQQSDHPTAASAHPSSVSSVQRLGLFGVNSLGQSSNEMPNDSEQSDAAETGSSDNLRDRRMKTSPEKFNTGQFEKLPLRETASTNTAPSQHLMKRLRANDGTARPTTPLTAALDRLGVAMPHIKKTELTAGVQGLGISEALPKAYKVPYKALASPAMLATPRKPLPRTFSLLTALCQQNNLLLHFVSYLTIPSLISLYSISKVFHHQMNCTHTAFIMSIVRTWAPGSEEIYPWRCYKKLCIKDPRRRQMSKWEGKEAQAKEPHQDVRDVPSIRWLQMVVYRHGVCQDMLTQLAVYGHRFPRGTLDALKRIWFIMDLPMNAHRISLLRSRSYISDSVLKYATTFFLKVDMDFTDPAGRVWPTNHPDQFRFPNKYGGKTFTGVTLRETLLAEKSLTPLWRVLRGWTWDPDQPRLPMDQLDIMRLWVRHHYKPRDDQPKPIREQDIMGIPWFEVGTAGLERFSMPYEVTDPTPPPATAMSVDGQTMLEMPWTIGRTKVVVPKLHKPRDPLLRPDELIMRESLRRDLDLDELWVRMMMWGWFDSFGRKIPLLKEKQQIRVRDGLPPNPPAPAGAAAVNAEAVPDEQREAESNGESEPEATGSPAQSSTILELEPAEDIMEMDTEDDVHNESEEDAEKEAWERKRAQMKQIAKDMGMVIFQDVNSGA